MRRSPVKLAMFSGANAEENKRQRRRDTEGGSPRATQPQARSGGGVEGCDHGANAECVTTDAPPQRSASD
jgi:hypothetical protein